VITTTKIEEIKEDKKSKENIVDHDKGKEDN
jgi:hypothetical protein